MADVVSGRGDRRAGAGRKPLSRRQKEVEKLRVQSALSSSQAGALFDRARRGDSHAARALRLPFVATGGPVDAPAPGLFAIVEAPAAASGEQRQ